MRKIKSVVVAGGLLALVSACAAHRPVLYPNGHLNTVGMEAAERDINDCMDMARASGAERDAAGEAGSRTVEGAVVGGATGGAVGAVLGHPGRGAASGAAGGAAGGLTRSLLNADRPDPVFERFVNRCLRDQGYEPVGWR